MRRPTPGVGRRELMGRVKLNHRLFAATPPDNSGYHTVVRQLNLNTHSDFARRCFKDVDESTRSDKSRMRTTTFFLPVANFAHFKLARSEVI